MVVVKVSPATAPLSDRLTPATAAAWPWPRSSLAGAAITGTGAVTVTAVSCDPLFPKLSLTATWIVSAAGLESVSVRVASAAFTWASVPVMVTLVVPEPLTPVALSRPWVSLTVAVKLSLDVLPLSLTETPVTAVGDASGALKDAGPATTGAELTVSAMFAGAAVPPMLSVAVRWMVSDPAVPSRS